MEGQPVPADEQVVGSVLPRDRDLVRWLAVVGGCYLAAADFGISFIRPVPSKVSSSPTKIGEFLGAGLPVVCTSGVGDLDALVTRDVGTLVRTLVEALNPV